MGLGLKLLIYQQSPPPPPPAATCLNAYWTGLREIRREDGPGAKLNQLLDVALPHYGFRTVRPMRHRIHRLNNAKRWSGRSLVSDCLCDR